MTYLPVFFSEFHPDNLVRAALLLVGGWFLSRLISSLVARQLTHRMRPHQVMLLRRVVFMLLFLLFLASAFQQLNFRISALLGATGILTVAIGIASQTSMSNVVSGLFLIGEKPFEIGDTISLNGTTGQIITIDSLSVRICTADNAMVRIPNEVIIKSAVTNLSHFPTRRADLDVAVAPGEKTDRVIRLLLELAQKNPLCLKEPAPAVIVTSLGEASTQLQLQIWVRTADRGKVQAELLLAIHDAFQQHCIQRPLPAQALFAGAPDQGFPVRLMPETFSP